MDSIWQRRRSTLFRGTHVIGGFAIAALTGLGSLMAVTNPGQTTYETFATQRLVTFLHDNVCSEAPEVFNLRRDCLDMVKNNRSQLRDFVAKSTYRRNFVFFSIYTTELTVAAFAPSYRVQTVGIFNRFYVYEALQE